MRAFLVAALAAATAVAASGQQPADSARPLPRPTLDGRLRAEIGVIRSVFGSVHAPPADSFVVGSAEVPAGTTWSGTLAVARGNLDVHGRISGDAVAIHGDVI